MATFIMATSQVGRNAEWESTIMQMETYTKENGKMMLNKEEVSSRSLREMCIEDFGRTITSMEKVNINLLMETIIKGTFTKRQDMVKGDICGVIKAVMKVIGSSTRCMDMESISQQMGQWLRVGLRMMSLLDEVILNECMIKWIFYYQLTIYVYFENKHNTFIMYKLIPFS